MRKYVVLLCIVALSVLLEASNVNTVTEVPTNTPVPSPEPTTEHQKNCVHGMRETVMYMEQHVVGDKIEWGVKDICKDCGLVVRWFIGNKDAQP